MDVTMRRRDSFTLASGAVIAALVLLGAAFAWPERSMLAAGYGEDGERQWLLAYGVLQALAFAVFLIAIIVIRPGGASKRLVLVLTGLIQLTPLLAPLMLSTDAWGYWSFARVHVVHGGNPYLDPQSAFPSDVAFGYTNPAWRDTVTPYGTLFTMGSEVIALVVGERADAAAWVFKAIAGALVVVLAVQVAGLSPRPAFAAAFIGWNPVWAMHFAGSGHNDVIMVVFLVAGIAMARGAQVRWAGVSWAVAAFIKWQALVPLPLQLAADRARGRRSVLPAFLLACGVLAVLSTAWYGLGWVGSVLPFLAIATGAPSLAIWPRLGAWLPSWAVIVVPLALFAAAYLVLLRSAWRGRVRRGLATALFLLASPFLWAWYLIYPASLSAAEDDVPAMALVLAMCVYAGLLYLGDAGSVFTVFLRA